MKKYNIRKLKDENSDLINFYIEIFNSDFSLFRYRTCNEHSIGAFYSDALSFSTPQNFNDPYDVTVRIDFEKVYDKILSIIKDINFDNVCKNLNFIFEEKDNNFEKVKKITDYYFKNLNKIIKTASSIACFSEKYDNELMWAHYANSGKGFVIEYEYKTLLNTRNQIVTQFENSIDDFYKYNPELFETSYGNISQMLEENSSIYGIVPVIYENGKYNGTYMLSEIIKKDLYLMSEIKMDDNINRIDINYPNNYIEHIKELVKENDNSKSVAMNTTTLYMKKKDWKYESEWRFVIPNTDGKLFNTYKFDYLTYKPVLPKAIILGEFITSDYEKMLVRIAYDKGLSIYKMKSDYSKNPPKLKKGRKYSKNTIEDIIKS